ncbi:MAG: PAS domain S-box protein, partial [Verrucomicrobia bacterium]|nr:PAS domain S-box protein [Verrucomicrobiota bacterium]
MGDLENRVAERTRELWQTNQTLQAEVVKHQRTEEALRWSETQLQVILESTADGILAVDDKGRVIKSNGRFAQLWRIPPSFVASGDDQVLLNFVLAQLQDPEAFLKKVQSLYGSDAVDMDTLLFKDGRVFERYSSPMMMAGLVTGRVWSFRDITERRQAEEAQARLATAVEQAAETMMITDANGTILYANPAFEKTTGYTRQEALGQNSRLLKSGKHDAEFYQRMWAMLTAGQVWSGHIINQRKDGTLYEEDATISPVFNAAGRIVNYVAVKRDVTREMALEAQYRQAQKMEAIGQLAGGVAHDFNNILAAFMMHLGLLRERSDLDAEIREDLQELESGARRAASLTRQLLMFSRRSVMQAKPLDLNEVIEDLLKMLRRLIGEHIRLQFHAGPALPRTQADAGMLEQVVMNLSINARDAMPQGGCLTLSTSVMEFNAAQAALDTDRRPGRFVRLSVADTGTGMNKATCDRLFEPFFTTKEVGKGTGLGLATV